MRPRLQFLAVAVGTTLFAHLAQAADPPHNVILFVPDGLRALAVTPQSAPTVGGARSGRQFREPAFAVPHVHHAELVGDVDRARAG